MTRSEGGFSLIEALVALLVIAFGVLAAVPMFVTASYRHADGGEAGRSAALALDRMELLRARYYDAIELGGSLDSDTMVDVTPYFDRSHAGYVVRWSVQTGPIPDTKTISVRAIELESPDGRRPQLTTLVTARGRE